MNFLGKFGEITITYKLKELQSGNVIDRDSKELNKDCDIIINLDEKNSCDRDFAKEDNLNAGYKNFFISGQGSSSVEKELSADWNELSMVFTQLGFSLVAVLEVADSFQMCDDIAKEAIEFAQSHPVIVDVPITYPNPIISLGSGIKVFKCIWAGFRVLSNVVIAIVSTKAYKELKFINRLNGQFLVYNEQTKEFIEGTQKYDGVGFPVNTDSIKKVNQTLQKFANECAQISTEIIDQPSVVKKMQPWEKIFQLPVTPKNTKLHIGQYTPSTNQMLYKIKRTISGNNSYGNPFRI